MRDKIYELATSSNSKIICTTHSPYMIDLSKRIDNEDYPKQVLNLFKLEKNEELNHNVCRSIAFNTSEAYTTLQGEDKDFIKFILKIDDYVAKVFFCKRVIVIEGDTEEILLKETVNRLEVGRRKKFLSNYQIVKARGKATIISLVKYLKALSITPFVIHDQDTEDGATKFNNPILEALDNNENNRYMVVNTIEDILGYPEPTSEKPYKAYKHITTNWGDNWADIPENWRTVFEQRIANDLFDE
jgi:putative ATP-dependent endonuclease of OLD family